MDLKGFSGAGGDTDAEESLGRKHEAAQACTQ